MTDFFENLLNNGELQEKVAELQGKIDAYQMSENEANEIITELKAENETLKKVKDFACINLKNYIADNDKLKAENERLKTQYNCYACGNCKGKEDYINLEKHHIGLRKQFDKKVRTLQEIKAIAENMCSACKENTPKYYVNCRYCNYKKLLDLITKAESEG